MRFQPESDPHASHGYFTVDGIAHLVASQIYFPEQSIIDGWTAAQLRVRHIPGTGAYTDYGRLQVTAHAGVLNDYLYDPDENTLTRNNDNELQFDLIGVLDCHPLTDKSQAPAIAKA